MTNDEVLEHQRKYGPNELIEEKKQSVIEIFVKQFADFLVLILIAAAVISIILDDI